MVSVEEKDHAARRAKAQAVALFRYTLIREAADASVGPRQRGQLVAAIVAATHRGPFGEPVRVSRASVDRWIRAWRGGGFEALIPPARQVAPRTETAVLEMAIALKRENPARTAAQVVRILRQSTGSAPSSVSEILCNCPTWTLDLSYVDFSALLSSSTSGSAVGYVVP